MFVQERLRCLRRTEPSLSMRLTPGGTFRARGRVAVTRRDYKSTSHEGLGQLFEPRASNEAHSPGYGACGSSSNGGYSSVSSK